MPSRLAKAWGVLLSLFFISCGLGLAREEISVEVGLLDVQSAAGGKRGSVEFRALRRIFDIVGIPYRVLHDVKSLDEYRVIYTGGTLLNTSASSKITNALYDYVDFGGVLLSAGEAGSRLWPLFGIKKHFPSRKRYRMSFHGDDVSLAYIDHPREKIISLGNGEKRFYDEVIWSHGYELEDEAIPLATFDDGTAAFWAYRYGRGLAYFLGLAFAESVLRPQTGEDYEAQRNYVNSFEPSADVIMLILKAIYEGFISPYVYLSAVPYARPTCLVLSHDVDAQTSFVDSLKFADLEERFGVVSTFFENTKYVVDWMDIDYYNKPKNKDAIRELKRRGWDIGSHTVTHCKTFDLAEEGNPAVSFKTYEPLKNITVHGEVRVSKELLDRDIPGQNTVSFRAGDLAFPRSLIRILEGADYLYDSTFSANDVLTAFPFFALRERHLDAEESAIVEIPLTFDDSMGFLKPRNVDNVVKTWLSVAAEHMKNEAINVLLIHPSDTRKKTYKLEAQEKLMQGIDRMGGWMGDLTSFGNFWRERHHTNIRTYLDTGDTLIIQVDRAEDALHPAIGFVVGNANGRKIIVLDKSGKKLDFTSEERGNKIFLGRAW